MDWLKEEAITVIIGVMITGGLTSVWIAIKWLVSIKDCLENMASNVSHRRDENIMQFKMLEANMKATRTVLEVTAQGKNNGNVEKAMDNLNSAEAEYLSFIKDIAIKEQT